MKNKDLHPRLLYPARLSFRIEGQVNNLPDRKKIKEFITGKPESQEILNEEREGGGGGKKIKSINDKMAIAVDLSIITLHVNKLNSPIKRHRVAETFSQAADGLQSHWAPPRPLYPRRASPAAGHNHSLPRARPLSSAPLSNQATLRAVTGISLAGLRECRGQCGLVWHT